MHVQGVCTNHHIEPITYPLWLSLESLQYGILLFHQASAYMTLARLLRHAEMLSLLATPKVDARQLGAWETALGWGRHSQGILQHHDAITGTGGSSCDAEYHLMLARRPPPSI